jgi:hypothetical protein
MRVLASKYNELVLMRTTGVLRKYYEYQEAAFLLPVRIHSRLFLALFRHGPVVFMTS